MAIKSIAVARKLRRDQTEAERLLWSKLRDRRLNGLKFRRQFPVEGYFCDFVCLENRIIVELDGGHHAEQVEEDQRRDAALEAAGFIILRFWNNDVEFRVDTVLDTIALTALTAKNEPIV